MAVRWFYFIGEDPDGDGFATSEYTVTIEQDPDYDLGGLVYNTNIVNGSHGTVENPLINTGIHAINFKGVSSYNIRVYTKSPGPTYTYSNPTYQALSNVIEGFYSPTRLFGIVNGGYSIKISKGSNGLEEIDDAIVYGKYRLKSEGLTGFDYSGFCFPCNVFWGGVKYSYIGSTTIRGADNTLLVNAVNPLNNSFSTDVSEVGCSVYNVEYTGGYYTYKERQITSDVVVNATDRVLNFGNTVQHVPKFFKDWLIENSEEIILPMQLDLFKNSAEPNRLDKTAYLESIGTLAGTLRNETSVTNVVMQIEYTKFPDFNYVYLAKFNRYYYVDDIISVRNNLWEIHMSVDVLMTYKDAILQCEAYVDRTANGLPNSYIPDDKLIVMPGYSIKEYTVENDIITSSGESGSYVLNGFLFTYDSINSQSAQSDNSEIEQTTVEEGVADE